MYKVHQKKRGWRWSSSPAQEQGREAAGGSVRSDGSEPSLAWRLDFVVDQFAERQMVRSLTIIEVYTRERVPGEADQRLKGR